MKLKTFLATAIAAAFLACFGQISAQAQSGTTFAGYTDASTSGNVYVFTNNGTGSTFVTAPANIPVNFTYNIANGYGTPGAAIPALLNLTSVVSAPATSAGPFVLQNITNLVLTIKTTTGNHNLLSLVFGPGGVPTTGNISGFNLDTRGTFGGSNANLNSVFFTSDYLDFTNTLAHGYAVSLTSITPVLSIGPGGFLNSFQAAGSASFASTLPAPAPEPSGLVTFVLLGGCLALCAMRRKAFIA